MVKDNSDNIGYSIDYQISKGNWATVNFFNI